MADEETSVKCIKGKHLAGASKDELASENRKKSTALNDKNGRLTNEQTESLKICKEHFDTVLNKEPLLKPTCIQ